MIIIIIIIIDTTIVLRWFCFWLVGFDGLIKLVGQSVGVNGLVGQ